MNSNLFYASFNITSDQLLTLATSPIEVIPAQGPNTVIEVVSASLYYAVGVTPFANATDLQVSYTGDIAPIWLFEGEDGDGHGNLAGPNSQFMYPFSAGNLSAASECINKGVVVAAGDNPGSGSGPIATSSLNNPGAFGSSAYAPGDLFTITNFSGDATGVVDTITNIVGPILSSGPGTNAPPDNVPSGQSYFEVAGDYTGGFVPFSIVRVYGSAGGVSDGYYECPGFVTFDGTNSYIIVNGAPTGNFGGFILSNNQGDIQSQVDTYHLTNDGTNYQVGTNNPTTSTSIYPTPDISSGQGGGPGVGMTIDVNSVTITPIMGTGTLQAYLTYRVHNVPS